MKIPELNEEDTQLLTPKTDFDVHGYKVEFAALRMFVVYVHPKDYPEHFVVREWKLSAGSAWPNERAQLAPNLDTARQLIPLGLFNIGRDETDEPHIVEVWI